MRKKGASFRDIAEALHIPKSTLSGWLKEITIPDFYKRKLDTARRKNLAAARKKAATWHSHQKELRVAAALEEATLSLERLDMEDNGLLELALAMLYLGEGSKRDRGLVLGNSNALILQFFVSGLKRVYAVDPEKFTCELHLRADQKPTTAIAFWSETLKIPKRQFRGVYVDQRSAGKKTFEDYHGVCVVSYNNVAIQRKLMYLYDLYCKKVIQKRG